LQINQTGFYGRVLFLLSALFLTALSATPQEQKTEVQTAPPIENPTFRFDRNGTTTIPFEFVENSIYVQVRINGEPLWFLLDSGSSFMLIDKGKAKALGLSLKGGRSVQGAGAGKVQIDYVQDKLVLQLQSLETSGYQFSAVGLQSVSDNIGHKEEGLLGYDFFKTFIVTVNYDAKTVTITDPKSFQSPAKGTVVPIGFQGKWPVLHATIAVPGNAPVDSEFVVDSGSGDAVDHPLIKQSSGKVTKTTSQATSLGDPVTGYFGHIDWLQIGPYRMQNPTAFCCGGLEKAIGGEILRRFTLTFDYGHSRMIFEPNAHLNDPFLTKD
jgi:hypothetical protein